MEMIMAHRRADLNECARLPEQSPELPYLRKDEIKERGVELSREREFQVKEIESEREKKQLRRRIEEIERDIEFQKQEEQRREMDHMKEMERLMARIEEPEIEAEAKRQRETEKEEVRRSRGEKEE